MTLNNTDSEYRVIVSNTQTVDGETDTIEEIAYGSFTEKNNKQYIICKTDADAENKGASTIFILDGDSLTIKRRGETNSSMVYRTGKKHAFPYETPYGIIDMEIETDKLVSVIDEKGGEIELVYTLTVQNEKYYNDMKITLVKR